jgi:type VI secretion system protein ImpA
LAAIIPVLTRLDEPLSPEAPCGPDLDAEYDPDFTNFMARIDGLLPAAYFTFDRSSIKFDVEAATIAGLLERTRDLRLLVVLSKLAILTRDTETFSGGLAAIAGLLETQWTHVHPAPDDGDVSLRGAILQTLDDLPHVVLPLQHITLAESRRYGAVRFRHELLANGETAAREDEETLDRQTIDLAMADADLDAMKAQAAVLGATHAAVGRIHTVWLSQAGHDQAVSLERVDGLLGRMVAFLGAAISRRDPGFVTTGAASHETAPAGQGPAQGAMAAPAQVSVGSIASPRDAALALAAVAEYFAAREPSSPSLLLVRQAEQLIGKSFLEVMQVLLPGQLDQANIQIGGQEFFDLPLERLGSLDGATSGAGYADDPPSWQSAEDGEVGDEYTSGTGDDGASDAGEVAETMPDGTDTQPDNSHSPPAVAQARESSPVKPIVQSRQAAMAVLQQVGTYFRAAEPSSPIPFLTERARSFAERDFLSLLKDVLPEASLKKIGGQD